MNRKMILSAKEKASLLSKKLKDKAEIDRKRRKNQP
jgi:hypothetical protein